MDDITETQQQSIETKSEEQNTETKTIEQQSTEQTTETKTEEQQTIETKIDDKTTEINTETKTTETNTETEEIAKTLETLKKDLETTTTKLTKKDEAIDKLKEEVKSLKKELEDEIIGQNKVKDKEYFTFLLEKEKTLEENKGKSLKEVINNLKVKNISIFETTTTRGHVPSSLSNNEISKDVYNTLDKRDRMKLLSSGVKIV